MSADSPISLLEQVVSGNVSDAMEKLRLPRRVLLGYKALSSGTRPMVGPAFTVQQAFKTSDCDRDVSKVRHGEVTRGLAQAGDVIVIATGGITSVATWGENHSMRCVSLGVRGMITDGATRDAALVERKGLPIYCRGFSPIKSLWDLQTVALGERVYIEAIPIDHRDIIFADETGILVIPAENALVVARLALDIRRQEESYQEAFQ